jgi:hypothetical protein
LYGFFPAAGLRVFSFGLLSSFNGPSQDKKSGLLHSRILPESCPSPQWQCH